MWLFVKNVIFTFLVPGTVAIYLPYRLIENPSNIFSITWGLLQFLSVILFLFGVSIYFWCLWDFAVTGRGTPAPIDAPKRLVIKGLYRYVRNPMYIGILSIILGWATLYKSPAVLEYAILMWLIFTAVIIIIEEPILRRQFDKSYKDYCAQVRRWIPGGGYKE